MAKRLKLPFAVLSDADLSVTLAFGVAMPEDDFAVPAVVVLARDGTIHSVRISEGVQDRPSPAEIADALRAAGR